MRSTLESDVRSQPQQLSQDHENDPFTALASQNTCPGCKKLKSNCKCAPGGGDEDEGRADQETAKGSATTRGAKSVGNLFLYDIHRGTYASGKGIAGDKEVIKLSNRVSDYMTTHKQSLLDRKRHVHSGQIARLLRALLILEPNAKNLSISDLFKILKDPKFQQQAKQLLALELQLATQTLDAGKPHLVEAAAKAKAALPHLNLSAEQKPDATLRSMPKPRPSMIAVGSRR